MTDRLPPFDENLEAATLGCLMLSPAAAVSEFVSQYRSASQLFYEPKHRRLFEIICTMVDAGKHTDGVTIASAIMAAKAETDCGGLDYVASLPDKAPSVANLTAYADELLGVYIRRRLVEVGTKITERGFSAEDAPSALDECEQELFAVRIESESTPDDSMQALVRRAIDHLEEAQQSGNQIRGLATGFPDIDRVLRGLRPGQMIVIAGRPGQGKTSLALNIAEHIAVDRKVPVGVFSLEMDRDDLALRLLCSRARVTKENAESRHASDDEMRRLVNASAAVSRAPLHICDEGGMSIAKLRAKARRMMQKHKVQLLVMDYLGLLTAKAENRTQEVSKISAGLKTLAKELRIPIIALAQLNRQQEKDANRKPRLSDLRDSGSIEQDADVVAFIHHTETETTLNIEKHRSGPIAMVPLLFRRDITRFESVAPSA